MIDLAGDIIHRVEHPFGGATGESVVAMTEELIAEAISAAPAHLLGIGIGTPGVVTPDGTVVEASNFPLARSRRSPAAERPVRASGVDLERRQRGRVGRILLRIHQPQPDGDQDRQRRGLRNRTQWSAVLRRELRRRRDRPHRGGGRRPPMPVRQPGLLGNLPLGPTAERRNRGRRGPPPSGGGCRASAGTRPWPVR